jgi:hypothetical protein
VPELREKVQRMFAVIELACGVRGRWLRRRDDPATYMEVYEGVEDAAAFEAVLEREAAVLQSALGVERRTERFVSA